MHNTLIDFFFVREVYKWLGAKGKRQMAKENKWVWVELQKSIGHLDILQLSDSLFFRTIIDPSFYSYSPFSGA
jgi:hypothetical protein